MKPQIIRVLLVVLLVTGSASAAAASAVVVVNERNEANSVSAEQLRQLLLGRQSFWGGNVRVVTAAMPLTDPAMAAFCTEILRKSPDQFQSYWRSRIFSGEGGAPRTFARAEDAVAFVRDNPGGIAVLTAAPAALVGAKVLPVRGD